MVITNLMGDGTSESPPTEIPLLHRMDLPLRRPEEYSMQEYQGIPSHVHVNLKGPFQTFPMYLLSTKPKFKIPTSS